MDHTSIRLLIVDDSLETCDILANYFAMIPEISVCGVAHDGDEALYQITQLQPDVVLLDLIMPKTDGLAVLDRLNHAQLAKRPRVIVTSAVGQESFTITALSLGADYYMIKPYALSDLSARICTALATGTEKSAPPSERPQPQGQNSLIARSLLELGIPTHMLGYRYCTMAVARLLRENRPQSIVKDVYTHIADEFSTTPECVEGAIRKVIRHAWRDKQEQVHALVGGTLHTPPSMDVSSPAYRSIFVCRLTLGVKTMPFDEHLITRLGLPPWQIFDQIQRKDHTGFFIYSSETREYWWSEQVNRIFGIKPGTPPQFDSLLGQIYEEDAETAKAYFFAALMGEPYHFVHRIKVRKTMKWIEQSGRLYHQEGQNTPYVLGTLRDVTRIKREEARNKAKSAIFSTITDYLAETTDTTDLSAIVASLKRTIRKRMDVALIAVFVCQDEQVSRVIPKNMDPKQAFLFQDLHDFIAYQAIITGKRQICPVSEYPGKLGQRSLMENGGQCVTSLPIKHGNEVIGALSIVTRHAGALTWEEDEFCRTICGYLSNQVNNALLYARLKLELERRTRLESDQEVIFNESVDFISIIDSEGCFAQINPSFAAWLGVPAESLLGRSIYDFVHPEDREYFFRVFSNLSQKEVVRGFRNRLFCKGNEIGHLESNLKFMPATRSTIMIGRDLTGVMEMKERNTLLEETIAFERSKSDFFAGLSHEFKTPLNILLSTLDLLRLKSIKEDEKRFQDEYSKFFNYAYQSCYKLLRLSSNLLDSSKIENGYYSLYVTTVHLDGLLQSIVDAAEIYANAKGVSLEYLPLQSGEASLACDEDVVDRILLNLLSNAIKNTQEGGLVRVSLSDEGSFFRIVVEDNGAGISPESLPHIFDKFITSRNPVSGQREGSGIGLSLVRSLVELHGGTILVESQVEKGSKFTFTLSKNLHLTSNAERAAGDAVAIRARLEFSDVK